MFLIYPKSSSVLMNNKMSLFDTTRPLLECCGSKSEKKKTEFKSKVKKNKQNISIILP